MTDLTTTNGQHLAKTASGLCTPELWRRLTDAGLSWGDACARLAEDPRSLAEMRDVGQSLMRHIEPCGDEAVIETLAPMLALFGVPRKSDAEAEAFWGFYLEALAGLPIEALRKGVAEYVADGKSEWFPKPGPLKAICERHAIPLRMAASRVRKALEIAQ